MASDDIGLFDAVHTARSSRRLENRSVPDDDVRRILDAARHATSPTNAQPWKFVVIRDAERRKKIGEIYLRAWEVAKPFYGDPAKARDDAERRMLVATDALAGRFGDVPCMIVCCLDRKRLGPLVTPDLQTLLDPASSYGSVWAAVQIMLLSARALGLAAVPTTLTRLFEGDVKELLGLPDGVETVCVVALGYPKAKFGTPARLPLADVAFGERWGEPLL
jgi:nitroreductase